MTSEINTPNGFRLRDGRKIPANRVVKIEGANGSIIGAPMFIDGELSLKVASKFGTLWDAKGSNLLTLLSSVSSVIPSGQFAMQGSQIWQSTDPLSLDLKVSLYMFDNALDDVVTPVLQLMSTCLPTKKGFLEKKFDFMGASINVHLDTLIPPGPDARDILRGAIDISGDSSLSNWYNQGSRGLYNVRIGNFTIPRVIITDVNPTFSEWTDENGNPISAEVSIGIVTMEIATSDMLCQIHQSLKDTDFSESTSGGLR